MPNSSSKLASVLVLLLLVAAAWLVVISRPTSTSLPNTNQPNTPVATSTPHPTRAPVKFSAEERQYLNTIQLQIVNVYQRASENMSNLLAKSATDGNLMSNQDWRDSVWAAQLDMTNVGKDLRDKLTPSSSRSEVLEIRYKILTVADEYDKAIQYINDYYGSRLHKDEQNRINAQTSLGRADGLLLEVKQIIEEMM